MIKEEMEEEEGERERRGGKGGMSSINAFHWFINQLIHGLRIILSTNQLVKELMN